MFSGGEGSRLATGRTSTRSRSSCPRWHPEEAGCAPTHSLTTHHNGHIQPAVPTDGPPGEVPRNHTLESPLPVPGWLPSGRILEVPQMPQDGGGTIKGPLRHLTRVPLSAHPLCITGCVHQRLSLKKVFGCFLRTADPWSGRSDWVGGLITFRGSPTGRGACKYLVGDSLGL